MNKITLALLSVLVACIQQFSTNTKDLIENKHQPILTKESRGKNFITLESLLKEMTNRGQLARYPEVNYASLQTSSYNRASIAPDKPGWFADSDGTSWIREEDIGGRKEYVIMEHTGSGCITRMWTPFFYYHFKDRTCPKIRIYIDGNNKPVIEDNFISLLTGKSFIRPPFANLPARAGVCILPIPFGKSCKIALDKKPFYNIINYRA